MLPRPFDHVNFILVLGPGAGSRYRNGSRTGAVKRNGPGAGPGSLAVIKVGTGTGRGKAKNFTGAGTKGTPTPFFKIRFRAQAGCAKPGYNPDTLCI